MLSLELLGSRSVLASLAIALALQVSVAPSVATAQSCTLNVDPVSGPFFTIQSALNVAAAGDVICIAPALYPETLVLPPGIDVTLRGTGSVNIDASTVPGSAPVISINGGQTNATQLVNLTINGGATMFGIGHPGIFVTNGARPTLRNLSVVNCSATLGGGLFADFSAAPANPRMVVNRCTFKHCFATAGAGVFVTRAPALQGIDISLSRSTLFLNDATPGIGLGGGLTASGYVHATMDHCLVNDNTANGGGGIAVTTIDAPGNPTLTLDQVALSQNVAMFFDGGGMFISGPATVRADNSQFLSNSASNRGGHVFANTSGGLVGGIAPTLDFDNDLFAHGNANVGGAIALIQTSMNITQSTFSANSAASAGGAIFPATSGPHTLTIDDSILFFDTAAGVSDEIFIGSMAVNVSNSDVEGGFAGTGNINANPVFAAGLFSCTFEPDTTFFLDQSLSPCIDAAGGVFALPLGFTTDPTGAPDVGPRDMGYHYPPPSCP